MKFSFRDLGLKLGLGAAVGACALLASVPVSARDHYRDRGDGTAIAIGAGILGLAVGAALADRDDRYYYDRDWYPARRYVTLRNRPGYYYYYEGRPDFYYRDRYYDRYYAPYYQRHYRDWRAGRRDYRRDYRHDRRDYYRDRRHHDRHHGRHHDRRDDYRHRGHR